MISRFMLYIDGILPSILRYFKNHTIIPTKVNVREQLRGYHRGGVSPAITPPRGIEGTNEMIILSVVRAKGLI